MEGWNGGRMEGCNGGRMEFAGSTPIIPAFHCIFPVES
jgi:hypothetical protein